MRKSKYSEEQIIGFLNQAEAGMPVPEVCRKGGFSDATFYKRRSKFAGMEASDAQRATAFMLDKHFERLNGIVEGSHFTALALGNVEVAHNLRAIAASTFDAIRAAFGNSPEPNWP